MLDELLGFLEGSLFLPQLHADLLHLLQLGGVEDDVGVVAGVAAVASAGLGGGAVLGRVETE